MISRLKQLLSPREKSPPTPPSQSFWDVMSAVVAGNPIPAPSQAIQAIEQLRALSPKPEDYLERLLRMTALHQTVVIQHRLLQTYGPMVQGGPFAGMTLLSSTQEGCFVPKLLGCYESALHPEWQRVIQQGYSTLVNIGCADGYYSVGLARHLPGARILAYDISAKARESCLALARLNGMEGRIEIGGEFHGADFASLPCRNVFVICDIEGAERELLDPQQYPNLKFMDLLVEMHQLATHQTDTLIQKRFKDTHHFKRIDAQIPDWSFPEALRNTNEIDKLLALWEWRIQPTPWAILLSKEHHQYGHTIP